MKLDTETVRAAAAGHWEYVIDSICGVTTSTWLDRKEQPCPKCNGKTRFRKFKDFAQSGGVYCSHCHSSENSDGFSTIQWLLDCDFGQALKKVADFLHLDAKPSRKKKQPAAATEEKRPKHRLILVETDIEKRKEVTRDAVGKWCAAKPGLQPEFVKRCQCVAGIYKGTEVLAFAGWLPGVDHETSITIYRTDGQPFQVGDESRKNINLDGSTDAIIIVGSRDDLRAAHTIWKCEGPPDAFALASVLPEGHIAVTNACGAKSWRPEFAEFFTGKKVYVIHDCDQPGQEGAAKWVQCLSPVADVNNVILPYDIEPVRGKDARDWIIDGGTWEQLQGLLPAVVVSAMAKQEPVKFAGERSMLADLGLDVLGQVDRPGRVLVYSRAINRLEVIDDIGRVKRPTLKGLCGEYAAKINTGNEDIPGTYKLQTIMDAIGLLGTQRVVNVDTVRGAGCWPSNGSGIVIVGNNEALLYRDRKLTKIDGARDGNELLGIGRFDSWYDLEQLQSNIAAVNVQWSNAVIDEAITYFRQWAWTHEDDPVLFVGCILASWIQTVWRFRPHIAISGKTNSGKSSVFLALEYLFGGLASSTSKSSAAGIRQTVQQSAMITMLDEFEKSKHRGEILEMIRAGTRGGSLHMGTQNHKPIKYTIRHMIWTSAVESGLTKAPDKNRFIRFELVLPKQTDHGKLPPPDRYYLNDLGQRLLAIAVATGIEARDVADQLRTNQTAGVDKRHIEAYAVPAAILAVATGNDPTAVLNQLLIPLSEEAEQISDEQELIEAILRCTIRIKADEFSAATLLEESIKGNEDGLRSIDHEDALAHFGIRFLRDDEKLGGDWVFVDPKRVRKGLSRNERDWDGQDISQYLLRVKGAKRDRRKIDGGVVRGITLPIEAVT